MMTTARDIRVSTLVGTLGLMACALGSTAWAGDFTRNPGVNVEALLGHEPKVDAVLAFMKKWGKEMTYKLAMDDPTKKTMSDAWITASGSLSIPTACIIDQRGKLAWVGYPDQVQS
jgi:hypothetical protein